MRFILTLAVALAGPVTALWSEQVDTKPSGSVMPIVLEGTLVTKAGAPVAGHTVFVFPIDDQNRVKRFPGISPDGRLLPIEPDAHPHARTGANGRFRIAYGKVTAVNLQDGKVLIAGLTDPGLTLGAFKRRNWRTLGPEANPLFLVPAPGAGGPKVTTRAGTFLVQFGKVMIPE